MLLVARRIRFYEIPLESPEIARNERRWREEEMEREEEREGSRSRSRPRRLLPESCRCISMRAGIFITDRVIGRDRWRILVPRGTGNELDFRGCPGSSAYRDYAWIIIDRKSRVHVRNDRE